MATDSHGMGIPLPADSTKVHEFPGVTRLAMERMAEILAGGTTAAATAAIDAAVGPAVAAEIAEADLVTGSDSRLPTDYPLESAVDVGWTDATGKLTFGLDIERGVTVAPVLESLEITAPKVNGIESLTVTTEASGLLYGVVDSNERIWEPLAVDEDGRHPQWVLDSMAARMNLEAGKPPTKYAPVADVAGKIDTTAHNTVSGPAVIGWGHSMLAGAGGNGTTVLSELATETGLTCKNGSVGGETSTGIVARQGGNPFLLLPAGGQIPASGGVTIPAFPVDGGGSSWPLLQGAGTDNGKIIGYLAGIKGELTLTRDPAAVQYIRDSRDVYTFTRETPGTAVTVNRPAPFYYDYGLQHRDDIAVFWIGRNNVSATDRVLADTAAAIQYMAALDKRFIIIADTTGDTETTGTANWTAVTTLNTKFREKYGRRLVDVRRYLIDYGLADAGITATAGDTTNIQGDTVPVSLRSDSLHLNAAGYTIVGKQVAARMRELGWVK